MEKEKYNEIIEKIKYEIGEKIKFEIGVCEFNIKNMKKYEGDRLHDYAQGALDAYQYVMRLLEDKD